MNIVQDRIYGAIFGQAIGDALGLATEFMSKFQVQRAYPQGVNDYQDMLQDYHRRRWKPGEWTDDTDQMLCILDSLLEKRGVDTLDIARRIREWAQRSGRGMGRTVHAVVSHPVFLSDPQAAARAVWEQSGECMAANGGVMRTSVLGVWQVHDPQAVRDNAAQVCRITHYDPRCVGSCVAVCLAIRDLLSGEITDMDQLIEQVEQETSTFSADLASYLRLAWGPLDALQLDEPDSIGYTLKAMGAAFWALRNAASFAGGLLPIIHEGGDADTNAAVTGALLGARFGLSAIPSRWVEGLVEKEALMARAEALVTGI